MDLPRYMLYAAAGLILLVSPIAAAAERLEARPHDAAAPGVFAIQPASVSSAGDTVVTLSGSGFAEGIQVEIEPGGLHLEGMLSAGRPPQDAVLHGDLALVAAEDARVYDVSNPEMPVLRSIIPGPIGRVSWTGDLAVLGGTELRVLDLADPSRPQVVGAIPDFYGYGQIVVSGSRAYVGSYSRIQIVDLSQPSAPLVVGVVNRTYDAPFDVENDRLYVSDGETWIWDVSDPGAPRSLGVVYTTLADDLDVQQNRLVHASFQGLRVYDVSDPQQPLLLVSSSTYVDGPALWLDDQTILTSYANEVVALDGTTLEPLARLRLIFGNADKARRDGNRLITRATYHGLSYILGVDDLLGPPLRHELELDDQVGAVDIADGRLYVSTASTGVRIFDIADPMHPVALGSFPTVSTHDAVTVQNGYAYVTGVQTRIVDVRDPADPKYLGSCPFEFRPIRNGIRSPFVYGTLGDGYLWVCDARDPTNPVLHETGVYLRGANLFDVGNQRLFAWAQGLVTIDLTDPVAPIEMAYVPESMEASELAAAGERVYVTGGPGLVVYDVSTVPPQRSGAVPGTYYFWLKSIGGSLIARRSSGFRVLELDDPDRPRRAAAMVSRQVGGTEFDGDTSVLAATSSFGSRTVELFRLNPRVRNLERESEGRLRFEVPASWAAGVYHVRIVNPDLSVRTAFHGLRVCQGAAVTATLAPGLGNPGLPLRWRVKTLDASGAPTGGAAGLELPPTSGAIVSMAPRPGPLDRIELMLDGTGRTVSILLTGPDPEALAGRWETYTENGVLPWPEREPGIFGDVLLSARTGRRQTLALASGVPRARSLIYELENGWLVSASTLDTTADFTIRVSGRGPCDGPARLSFREALGEYCVSTLPTHPELAPMCPVPPRIGHLWPPRARGADASLNSR